jgi:hypothetical protein
MGSGHVLHSVQIHPCHGKNISIINVHSFICFHSHQALFTPILLLGCKAKRQEREQKKNARISRCTFCKSRNHNRRRCDQDTQPEEGLRDSSDDDDDDSENSFILNKITENDDYDFSANDDIINDFAAFFDLFTSEDVTSSFADFSDISANVIESSFADFSDLLTDEDARVFDSKIHEENERNKDIKDVKSTRQISSFAEDM